MLRARRPAPLPLPLSLLCLLLLVIGSGSQWIQGQDQPASPPPGAPPPIAGIENLRQVTPGILSGSQPNDEHAFEELARRGVKVIISVDGAAPQVETAKQYKLRYVHIPIGYDQIKPQARADLVQAIQSANGTVFVHCHHGNHRGPAAAAYCGMAIGKLTETQALDVLTAAGTRSDYTGLWDAVRKFERPTVPAGKLVEVADVEPRAASMVRIEHHWTGIGLLIKAGQVDDWKKCTSEALLLAEEFRELPITAPSDNAELTAQMQLAIKNSQQLLKTAEKKDFAGLTAAFKTMSASCTDCHADHRN